jgi:hypothetical protein
MTRPFIDEFERRRTQVRRYLATVSKAEREDRVGDRRRVQTETLHVLRAGVFLITYNLVEASIRSGVEAIHDEMAVQRVNFGALNNEIRKEVVKGFKKKAKPERDYAMADLPVDIVAAALDVEYEFSGNVDARLIRSVSEIYGFSTDSDRSRTYNGADLLTIKTNRNDLAHGLKTYDEVGRDFTTKQLVGISFRAMNFISAVLGNISTYLDNSGYLAPPPQEEDEAA